MKEIEHQKKAAQEMLEKIYTIDPFAIVAGGAPRDWYYGKVAKDIDIFFYRPRIGSSYLRNMFSKMGIEVEESEAPLNPLYATNKDVKSVWNYTSGDLDFQFIRMEVPTFQVVSKFPLSICQAWFKKDIVKIEEAFLLGDQRKLMFKTNKLYNNGNEYLERIRQKFPDFLYMETMPTLKEDQKHKLKMDVYRYEDDERKRLGIR